MSAVTSGVWRQSGARPKIREGNHEERGTVYNCWKKGRIINAVKTAGVLQADDLRDARYKK